MLKTFFAFILLLSTVLMLMQHSVHQTEPAARTSPAVERSLTALLAQQRRVETQLETLAVRLAELQTERPAELLEEEPPEPENEPPEPEEEPAAEPAETPPPRQLVAPSCPDRKPYHTLLTATSSNYQQWQSRIMYHHFQKHQASKPCADAVGFTRLCATPDGRPDGLEKEIPSFFTVELSHQVLAKHFGFGVLNRPNSVRQLMEKLAAGALPADKPTDLGAAEYFLILETDHVIMNPIPNLATPTTPAGYIFGYMYANARQDYVIKKYWPEGDSRGLDPVGPSPVIIHKDQLAKVYRRWLDFSMDLRSNGDAERVIQGWVQEMWGYSIAAASLGIKHKLVGDFQVEPGALSTDAQLRDFSSRYYIFHYTYQFEYMLDGTPCQPWNIGEFSLDKRHFNDAFPAYPLPLPPKGANVAAFFLVNAWNEAMGAAGPDWPLKQPAQGAGGAQLQTVYGRRRLDWFSRHANGFQQELRKSELVQKLAGSAWQCTEQGGDYATSPLELARGGDVAGLKGRAGRWGTLNDPTLGEGCPVYACLFVDMSGMLHNARVSPDQRSLHIQGSAYARRSVSMSTWSCTRA